MICLSNTGYNELVIALCSMPATDFHADLICCCTFMAL